MAAVATATARADLLSGGSSASHPSIPSQAKARSCVAAAPRALPASSGTFCWSRRVSRGSKSPASKPSSMPLKEKSPKSQVSAEGGGGAG